MECLCKDWRSSAKRLANLFELFNASLVPSVCRIEQSHERTGIKENHRPIFRRTASFTARFASAAGARDQPPTPRSSRR